MNPMNPFEAQEEGPFDDAIDCASINYGPEEPKEFTLDTPKMRAMHKNIRESLDRTTKIWDRIDANAKARLESMQG